MFHRFRIMFAVCIAVPLAIVVGGCGRTTGSSGSSSTAATGTPPVHVTEPTPQEESHQSSVSPEAPAGHAAVAPDPETSLEARAESGDAQAQHELALRLFEEADDRQPDAVVNAVQWMKAAAAQRYQPACLGLASMHLVGLHVEQDADAARQLFEFGISPDNGDAEAGLGLLFHCQEQFAEARAWFEKSAAKGCTIGDNHMVVNRHLGHMNFHGIGGQRDLAASERHLRLAAEKGCDASMACLGDLMIQIQSSETASAEGVEWYERAASKGNAHANYNLGVMAYQHGDAVAAGRHFVAAAGQGHADAASNYGVILFQLGDYDQSERWLVKAIELGSADAILQVGVVRRQRQLEERLFEKDLLYYAN